LHPTTCAEPAKRFQSLYQKFNAPERLLLIRLALGPVCFVVPFRVIADDAAHQFDPVFADH